jgi:hypothetical protein
VLAYETPSWRGVASVRTVSHVWDIPFDSEACTEALALLPGHKLDPR